MNLQEKPFYLTKEAADWVEQTLSEMTQEEKIGQIFCPIGLTAEDEDLKAFVEAYHPGGMMYRPDTSEKILHMHNTLQSCSKIPMLFGANLEAGGNGIVTDGTCLGKQLQVAATGEEEQAYRLGKVAGREAAAVGCNWSFGPIVDIDKNFRNPIMNVRTFGSDPERVLQMGKAYLKGAGEAGIATAAKHFPGDGVDERDQHLMVTENSLSTEEWDASYGKIYKGMIEAGTLSIMAAHIRMPAYQKQINPKLSDAECMPATLSKELLGGLLRKRLGFNGVIITDATPMLGFNTAQKRSEAVPRAIAAGCDMILFHKQIDEDYQAVRDGIARGILTWERMDEAIRRILAMKAALNLHQTKKTVGEEHTVGCPLHREWARECADKAVTLVKDTQSLLPLSATKYKKIRLHILGDEENGGFKEGASAGGKIQELLEKEGFQVTVFDKNRLDFHEIFEEGVSDLKKKFDLAIYVANVETASNQTTTRVDWVTLMAADAPWYVQDIPVLFLSTANPYHLFDVPYIKTYINAYSAHEEVLEAVVEKLMGRSPFKGINPVDPFCGDILARS